MCVIGIVENKRPSKEMVTKMFDANPSGAGIAWPEKGLVKWKKGLTLEEVWALAETVPTPYVLHFRIPSCGGKFKALCHPFPISKEADVRLEGATKGFVLFHNGHWGAWKDNVVNAVVKGNMRLPLGKWSDSRAIAWMAGNFGLGMLELIDEKTVSFGPEAGKKPGHIKVTGSGWAIVEGVWVSNRGWETKTTRGFSRFDDEDWENGYGNIAGPREWDRFALKWVPRAEYEEKLKAETKTPESVDTRLPERYRNKTKELPAHEPTAALGGAAEEDPFVVACRLNKAGKLSKKGWKRALKKHRRVMRKLETAQLRKASERMTQQVLSPQ